MNMDNLGWEKLVAAARRVRDDRPEAAPYGFSTRVVATAMSTDARSTGTLFERWSWRALAVAGIFAAVGVVTNYHTASSSLDDDIAADETTVAALFD